MWGMFTSERVIGVLYQVSGIDAMVITRCGKMLEQVIVDQYQVSKIFDMLTTRKVG